ncbi:hypothetical protein KL942_003886 [Ogataea angusta]|uniref:Uncharacterized protein n=1 Tax=Pichia angusta TaxID=870730 RepID=A0ABQ7RVB3_PICAN|nr:hypothetical protein KL942_003886 [Ogataea angusta]KAG7848504.1 hypothetical protein KL940_003359 [Ogataea angusta]KAG7856661.1 hypothetical protein KL919_004191 [Ogataea angusta]
MVAKELAKLNTDSLFNLVELWLKMSATQPKLSKDQRAQGLTQKQLLEYCNDTLKALKDQKAPKRKLIDRLLVDYYPSGLNALQLAQIDIQMMVDKPNNYSWVSSTAKIVKRKDDDDTNSVLEDFIFSLDSQAFLDRLITNLSNLYLTHIYISRHPNFPLILIRIQMYEYVHFKKTRTANPAVANKNQPDILSRTPYYLAIPMSSPNLIHSAANEEDLVSKIILQPSTSSKVSHDLASRLLAGHLMPMEQWISILWEQQKTISASTHRNWPWGKTRRVLLHLSSSKDQQHSSNQKPCTRPTSHHRKLASSTTSNQHSRNTPLWSPFSTESIFLRTHFQGRWKLLKSSSDSLATISLQACTSWLLTA